MYHVAVVPPIGFHQIHGLRWDLERVAHERGVTHPSTSIQTHLQINSAQMQQRLAVKFCRMLRVASTLFAIHHSVHVL